MKKYTFLLLLLILKMTAIAQTVRSYNISSFTKLDMGSAFHISVSHGNSFKVQVKGAKKDLEELKVYAKNKTLYAHFDNNWSILARNKHDKIELVIEMPELEAVNFSGASNSIISGFDELKQLSVELSGASKSKIDVFAEKINVDVSGASNLKLVGRANSMNIDLSGASGLDASNFAIKVANIEASGASNAKVSVSETINLEASGASNIKYIGNPKIRKNTSGAASISRIQG